MSLCLNVLLSFCQKNNDTKTIRQNEIEYHSCPRPPLCLSATLLPFCRFTPLLPLYSPSASFRAISARVLKIIPALTSANWGIKKFRAIRKEGSATAPNTKGTKADLKRTKEDKQPAPLSAPSATLLPFRHSTPLLPLYSPFAPLLPFCRFCPFYLKTLRLTPKGPKRPKEDQRGQATSTTFCPFTPLSAASAPLLPFLPLLPLFALSARGY